MQFPSVYVQLLVILISFCSTVDAENFRTQLTEAAKTFLQKKAEQTAYELNADQYQIHIRPLAEHTKLPACKTTVFIKNFNQSPYGEQILQAICQDHWKLLLKARILIFLPVIISARKIPENRVIQEEDIEWQSRDISILTSGYLTNPHQVLGRRILKSTKAGIQLNHDLFIK